MHELSLAQSIVEIVEQHLRSVGLGRVTSVRVKVGEMSNVVPESLSFCFDTVTEGTPLDGAHLEIERVPLSCLCRHCRQEFEPRGHTFHCPDCGSQEIEIVSGMELNIVGFELAGTDGVV